MRTLHLDRGKIWRGGQRQCLLLSQHLAGRGWDTCLACQPGSELASRWRRRMSTGAAGAPEAAQTLNAARAPEPVRTTDDVRAPDATEVSKHLQCRTIAMRGEGDLLAAARLANLMAAWKPDLAAAHDANSMMLLALARALRRLRVPLVFHRRVDVAPRRGPLSRWKVDQADLIICVSERIAQIMSGAGVAPERLRVVHSGTAGIAPDRMGGDRLRDRLGIAHDALVLGVVSSLIPHKGHRDLLAAMARLGPQGQDVHLIFAGDGSLRATLESEADLCGLADRVHFLGEVKEVAAVFGAINVYVHPSRTEGLGSSIADAFSAGVPVVATRAGGIPEMVREGETGYLADPGDAVSLSGALARALADPGERRRRATLAQTRFGEHFTAEAMVAGTVACYRELLERTGS